MNESCLITSCSAAATHVLEHRLRGTVEVCRSHAGVILAEGLAPTAKPLGAVSDPQNGPQR